MTRIEPLVTITKRTHHARTRLAGELEEYKLKEKNT
jgi:hypothetical protein